MRDDTQKFVFRPRVGFGLRATGLLTGQQLLASLFNLFARCDVVNYAHHPFRRAWRFGLDPAFGEQPPHVVPILNDAELDAKFGARLGAALDGKVDCGAIVGMRRLEERLESPIELFRLQAEQLDGLAIPDEVARPYLPLPGPDLEIGRAHV